jgi:SAM-dependent methyltransferase
MFIMSDTVGLPRSGYQWGVLELLKTLALQIPFIRRLWEQRNRLVQERDQLAKEPDLLLEYENKLTSVYEDVLLKTQQIEKRIDALQNNKSSRTYLPSNVFLGCSDSEYMKGSCPVATDFYHPEFADFLKRQFHRKLWEFAYIEHHLSKAGVLAPDKKGLCFGAGQEPLPALFAARGCKILATDAPAEIIGEKWTESKEFSNSLSELNFSGMIEREEFLRLVSYDTCDMNNIPTKYKGFDFCWSACCLEHLGDIDKGLQFIANSLKTLKRGGVAVHTTELNISSSLDTIEAGETVLYRRSDLENFIIQLRAKGHKVQPLAITPPSSIIDHHIDFPPYSHNPHLKLELANYVTTSVGIVIQKA